MMDASIIGTVIAVVTLVLTVFGIGVRWVLKEIKDEAGNRESSAKVIIDQQHAIKSELRAVTDGHERQLEKLELKAASFWPEERIKTEIRHAKDNYSTELQRVDSTTLKLTDSVLAMRDRVTIIETELKQTDKSVTEIKVEFKQMRQELNDRFDTMAKQSATQFDQLCQSIREIRKTPEAK